MLSNGMYDVYIVFQCPNFVIFYVSYLQVVVDIF